MPPSLPLTTTVTGDHHVDHDHHDHDDDGLRPPPPPRKPPNSPSAALPYLNDPSLRAPVRVEASLSPVYIDERDRRVVAAALAVCPGFFVVPDGDGENDHDRVKEATVRPLSGGLSNALFVVSTTAPASPDVDVDVPPFVLARVHFDDDKDRDCRGDIHSDPSPADALVDREREVAIMCHLSRSGLAPRMYGRFANGRIEEFYDGARPLSPSTLKDDRYWTAIAGEMARFHRHVGIPALGGGAGGGVKIKAECWDRIDGWFALAAELSASGGGGGGGPGADARLARLDVGGTMLSEWRWLKAQLMEDPSAGGGARSEAVRFARQVVFCHMDCQSLNILVPSSESVSDGDTGTHPTSTSTPADVRFIDFEYAGYNPRAADVANTFCECCDMNDLRADWPSQYPTRAQQDAFLRAYVRTADPDLARRLDDDDGGGNDPSSPSWEGFLAGLRDEVGRHALVSHVGWAVWAVVQAAASPIEFDFVAYAAQRMDGYRFFRERYFGLDGS